MIKKNILPRFAKWHQRRNVKIISDLRHGVNRRILNICRLQRKMYMSLKITYKLRHKVASKFVTDSVFCDKLTSVRLWILGNQVISLNKISDIQKL